MKNFKFFAIILLIIALSVSIIGCGNSDISQPASSTEDDSQNNSSEEKTIVHLTGGDYGEPSPYNHYPRGPGISKMQLVFDSLLEKDENGLIPWLANSWSIEDDGKTYIFNIHENVKWHDGEEMTAEDVKFSFDYFMKYSPVSNNLLLNGEHFIENIEVLDTHQVKFSVKEGNATILNRIGTTRIIPKHIWANVEDPKNFSGEKALIGCGPFICEEYNKELGSYKFVAFKDYWGLKQSADEIHYVPVNEQPLAYEKKDIDLAYISPDILPNYQNNDEHKVVQLPAFFGYRFVFNLSEVNEFKQKEIRQAMAYAIDTDDIIEKVARGAGVPASAGYLPVNHVWYNEDVAKYEHDVEKAKSLLGDTDLNFEILVSNGNTNVRIAELIKMYLEQVGINVTVKSVDVKTLDAAIKSDNYQAVIYGHGGWGMDADILRTVYASESDNGAPPAYTSIPGYKNDAITELANKQLFELDSEKRKEIVLELQKLISEDLPMIPLYNAAQYIVYRPSVSDNWMTMYDHNYVQQSKLSYLLRDK